MNFLVKVLQFSVVLFEKNMARIAMNDKSYVQLD